MRRKDLILQKNYYNNTPRKKFKRKKPTPMSELFATPSNTITTSTMNMIQIAPPTPTTLLSKINKMYNPHVNEKEVGKTSDTNIHNKQSKKSFYLLNMEKVTVQVNLTMRIKMR